MERFAACFTDHREAERVEHTVRELVAQRVYGLTLGYEDLNDQDELRRDPLLAVLAEKEDPTGESRAQERDRGKALAGKSTLIRLELTKEEVGQKERYKKIVLDAAPAVAPRAVVAPTNEPAARVTIHRHRLTLFP